MRPGTLGLMGRSRELPASQPVPRSSRGLPSMSGPDGPTHRGADGRILTDQVKDRAALE